MDGKIVDWVGRRWFSLVHGNSLVYNACWEDPRLDRVALGLTGKERVLTITSAGCNVLDYALAGAGEVHAVDVNPRQNALLELKIAGIRSLDFQTFFALFGEGKHDAFPELYARELRPLLSAPARKHWDCRGHYFTHQGPRSGLYFQGAVGVIARLLNRYVDCLGLRGAIREAFEAKDLAEQERIYWEVLRDRFWRKSLRTALNWDLPFAFLGVPRVQKRELDTAYPGGVAQFVEQCLETVFARLPLKDNYFWWLYFNGSYSRERCPEYLKYENFHSLKAGLVDRIRIHTGTLLQFMTSHPQAISRFVLLDHMDWLRGDLADVLRRQWQRLLQLATPDARILWRSASPWGNFVDSIEVVGVGGRARLGEALVYNNDLAQLLHTRDRVQTYGSFSIASLAPGFSC